mmetsp:Transcript_23149/g.58693  ORF Transcript_23149/g.58693 Transcript_23149/m.58693 type:complete len:84 (-) Transcript_23149:358-609(-)
MKACAYSTICSLWAQNVQRGEKEIIHAACRLDGWIIRTYCIYFLLHICEERLASQPASQASDWQCMWVVAKCCIWMPSFVSVL